MIEYAADISCTQIVASISEEAAGPSYSVTRLAAALRCLGTAVRIRTVSGWRGGRSLVQAGGSCPHRQDFPHVPLLGKMCFSSDMYRALKRDAAAARILHTHGLWLIPNVYPALATRRARQPFIVSPRGMLASEAMRFSTIEKAAFWQLCQKRALVAASCIHATSEQEHEEIRAKDLRNPVAVISNGIDLPSEGGQEDRGNERVVLSLGRLHPKKGLDRLIEAWAKIELDFPTWRLRIVGPDENSHRTVLERLIVTRGVSRASIEGPLFGVEKATAFRTADVFVLPSLNENFGLTAAEAMATGLPVIATKGTPWRGLAEQNCGWWVDLGVEPLAAALREAMARPRESLAAMGARGRAWMATDFSWDAVARHMLDVYRWLATGESVPACVRLK